MITVNLYLMRIIIQISNKYINKSIITKYAINLKRKMSSFDLYGSEQVLSDQSFCNLIFKYS